jgi:hypothetical protein
VTTQSSIVSIAYRSTKLGIAIKINMIVGTTVHITSNSVSCLIVQLSNLKRSSAVCALHIIAVFANIQQTKTITIIKKNIISLCKSIIPAIIRDAGS